MKYVKVMDGTKSNASGFEYKIDEINYALKWNPASMDPEKMGGFNFSNEESILRWTIRGNVLYDVTIPEEAEIICCDSKNTPNGVFRSNQIIVSNPREIDEDLMLELYEKSKLPLNTYFQCLSFLSLKNYKKTCLRIIIDKIDENNIEQAYNTFINFLSAEDIDLYNYVKDILEVLIKFYKNKKYFIDFVNNNYDINNDKIKHKLNHTFNVVKNALIISLDLGLSKEDLYIALLVALLHDIGRFDQAINMQSFREDIKKYDHALLGSILLFDNNEIINYTDDKNIYDIIKYAIINHSKYQVDYEKYTEQEKTHIKIIRDADKLDSFRAKYEEDIYTMANITTEDIEKSYISDKVYNDFLNHKTILSSDRNNGLDMWISYIAFVFDLNFDCSLKIIYNNDYINKLFDKYNYVDKDKINKLKEDALKYIKK